MSSSISQAPKTRPPREDPIETIHIYPKAGRYEFDMNRDRMNTPLMKRKTELWAEANGKPPGLWERLAAPKKNEVTTTLPRSEIRTLCSMLRSKIMADYAQEWLRETYLKLSAGFYPKLSARNSARRVLVA